MFSLLDNIREKPESKRRVYALLITVFITMLIVGVWLSIILTQGIGWYADSKTTTTGTSTAETRSEKETSPLDSLQETGARLYSDIKEWTQNTKEDIDSLSE